MIQIDAIRQPPEGAHCMAGYGTSSSLPIYAVSREINNAKNPSFRMETITCNYLTEPAEALKTLWGRYYLLYGNSQKLVG